MLRLYTILIHDGKFWLLLLEKRSCGGTSLLGLLRLLVLPSLFFLAIVTSLVVHLSLALSLLSFALLEQFALLSFLQQSDRASLLRDTRED